jgi:YggT family protein
LITVGTVIAAGLFILRAMMSWLGANPFGRVAYNLTRWTEPLVRPLRYQFSGPRLRNDLLPLVVGVMILVTGLFIAGIISQFAGVFESIGAASRRGLLTARFLLGSLIMIAGLLYVVAIFLRFFLPFFGTGYSSPLFRFLFVITEPLLKPLRRFFVAGMFDFSPLILMLLVQLITSALAGWVSGG